VANVVLVANVVKFKIACILLLLKLHTLCTHTKKK